jgi:hypothetical protein
MELILGQFALNAESLKIEKILKLKSRMEKLCIAIKKAVKDLLNLKLHFLGNNYQNNS